MSDTIPEDIKRSPGRPKTIADALPVKKGKKSWKPAALNEFMNKEAGYTYRMIRKDPDNLAKKQAEGWETVSAVQSGKTKRDDPGRINDGKPMTSVQEGKDWVLGRIPEEDAQARNDYFSNENQRRVAGLTAHLKKEAAKEGTAIHGNITISSRHGTQEID